MAQFLLKQVLLSFIILIAVNIITFGLFFGVNTPDNMARLQLGQKHISQVDIERWKKSKGYDKPLFFNAKAEGLDQVKDTLFFQKSLRLFVFDFGTSDSGDNISSTISVRMWPSLALAVPSLILGLVANISCALLIIFFRATFVESVGLVACIVLMSISGLFYIVFGQALFSKFLHLVPISGYDSGLSCIKFLLMPIILGIIGGIGASVRWYRALFIEEINKDYVRTGRAKGLSEVRILFKHILPNAMIPILTGVVVVIPLLFMGSLIMESFFGIPGLGSYTIDAISNQDFAVVRSMVFLGAVLYIVGLILTDISYSLVDPRVRLS